MVPPRNPNWIVNNNRSRYEADPIVRGIWLLYGFEISLSKTIGFRFPAGFGVNRRTGEGARKDPRRIHWVKETGRNIQQGNLECSLDDLLAFCLVETPTTGKILHGQTTIKVR